jgi:ribosome-associated toxin RatA of RatAB toxin-antitoxin module
MGRKREITIQTRLYWPSFAKTRPLNSIQKSVLIWYSAQQMFDLVSDVASYPQFLPWCDRASVVQRHADGQTAEIGLNFRGLRQSFTTRNTHVQLLGGVMEDRLQLVNGPFSKLDGVWRFSPVGGADMGSCKIELQLSYDFDNVAMAAVVGPVFDWIASSLVDAFVKRAEQVYGG